MARVLVTGGTGFIGQHLVKALVERGDQVVLLRRNRSNVRPLEGLPIEHAIGDVTDPASLKAAIRGCDTVFHVAALISYRRRDNLMPKINVEGTRHVVEAALEAGVKRFVHTSSVAAIGYSEDGRPIDETAPFNWPDAGYMLTKKGAEEEVQKGVAKGLSAVITNPASVYGPGSTGNSNKAFTQAVPGYPEGGMAVVDVDDVVQGLLAAEAKGRVGERYILASENLHWRELFAKIAKAMNRRPPGPILPGVMPVLGAVLENVGDWLGQEPLLTRDMVRMSNLFCYYDNTKAVRELGLTFRPFDETVARTAEWVKQQARKR